MALLCAGHVAYGQDDVVFPLVWDEFGVEISIHGVFEADDATEEGYVSHGDTQYKVLISYRNPTNRTIIPSQQGNYPSVGYLYIETASGNHFSPKYLGGATLSGRLDPGEIRLTHNYTFNIPEGEIPDRLHRYAARDDDIPAASAGIDRLLPPPPPPGERIVSIGESLVVGHFQLQFSVHFPVVRVSRGPFVGDRFGVFEPREGYAYLVLELLATNTSDRSVELPLVGRDGQFEVELASGSIYDEVSTSLHLSESFGRLVEVLRGAAGEDTHSLVGYPYAVEPRQAVRVAKGFEIPVGDTPLEVRFRTLGEVTSVRVRLRRD